MGFTKLDEGILQSSIIGESSDVFKVWIALLASCKEDGVARVSPVFLSSVCKLEIGLVIKAIERLMSPDPYSRSKEEDGRRLKEVDGGYWLVNYLKYRDRTYSGSKEAVKKRNQRAKSLEKEVLANPLHSIIIKRFCEGYEQSHGIKYMGVRHDVKELSAFLKDNPDMTEELYFKAANLCIDDPFHSKNLTMRYVCKHFNTLLAKVNDEE